MKRVKRPKEIDREIVGLRLFDGRRSGMSSCHLMYRVRWSDGSTTVEAGKSVHTAPGIGDLGKGKTRKASFRPELDVVIRAAALLNERLVDACLFLEKGGRL